MRSADQILLGVLHNPLPRSCWAAIDPLARLGGAAVEPLIPLLGHPNADIQIMAARSLERIGRPAHPATAALLNLLFDPAQQVRAAAAHALFRLSPPLKQALPLLIGRLQVEPDSATQVLLAQLCGRIGPQAAAAIPQMLEILEQCDLVGCHAALLHALSQIDAHHPALAQHLRDLLLHHSDDGSVAAAQIVGSLRLQAPEWAALLHRSAHSRNRRLRHAARQALLRIRSRH